MLVHGDLFTHDIHLVGDDQGQSVNFDYKFIGSTLNTKAANG